MAHRQKYLAGGYPVITLEEAYWKVMSTITKVNDLIRTCVENRITTLEQRLEAENLRHVLVDQDTHLYDIWRSEKNVEKLYNTRELVQIIDEEVVEKLATLKNTIISLPGTTPNPRPSSLSPPRPPPTTTLPTGKPRTPLHERTLDCGQNKANNGLCIPTISPG